MHNRPELNQKEGKTAEVASPEKSLVSAWKVGVDKHSAAETEGHDNAWYGVSCEYGFALVLESLGWVAQLHGMLAEHNQWDDVFAHQKIRTVDRPRRNRSELELVRLTGVQALTCHAYLVLHSTLI